MENMVKGVCIDYTYDGLGFNNWRRSKSKSIKKRKECLYWRSY